MKQWQRLFLFPTISWYYFVLPLPRIPQENTWCTYIVPRNCKWLRQTKEHLMNLWMCMYVQYVPKHTHILTHWEACIFPYTFTCSHEAHVHAYIAYTCTLSLWGYYACLRNIWSPAEFNVSTGGDQVISGPFYIQFDITCNIQHSTMHTLYILLCVNPIDDPGWS